MRFYSSLDEIHTVRQRLKDRRRAARQLGDDERAVELTDLIRRANMALHAYEDICRPSEEKEPTDDEKSQSG